jgi:hypothetical protein
MKVASEPIEVPTSSNTNKNPEPIGSSIIRRPEEPPAARAPAEPVPEEATPLSAEPEEKFESKEIVINPEHISYMPAIIRPQPITPQLALETPVAERAPEAKQSNERFKALEAVEDWMGRTHESHAPEAPATASEDAVEIEVETESTEPVQDQVIEPPFEAIPETLAPQVPIQSAPAELREPEIRQPAPPIVRSSVIHTQPPAEPRPASIPILSSSSMDGRPHRR